MRLLVGISGASGAVYGVRLLEILELLEEVETHLVISPAARETITLETGRDPREVEKLADEVYRFGDIAAAPSSGSFRLDAMVVVPCSMRTLAAIAYSLSDNLLVRAADVALKERRPLILAPRETPLHLGHLRSMVQVCEMGAILAPPMPAFYHRPTSVEEIVDQTVNRLCDLLRLELPEDLFRRWRGAQAVAREAKLAGEDPLAGVKVALAQITTSPYAVEENRARTVSVARELFEGGADLVILPELAVTGYVGDRDRLLPLAEPVEGPTFEAWRELAAQAGGVVVGGLCETGKDGIYNSAIAVGREGLLLHYRKAHRFAAEKDCFLPGDLGFPVANTPVGRLGICVCYDLRFVEVVRLMALRDAELICVPTAWLAGYDAERWDERGLCPQAHGAILQANLSQVFIACASQAGPNGEADFLGSSIVADPWGKLVLGPLPGEAEATATVEVELADAVRARVRGPQITPREDRRRDIYGIWADGAVL